MPANKIFAKRLENYRQRVEQALEARLPAANIEPVRLHQAMRYAVLNGGKRIRAVLVYATGKALNAELDHLDAPACAMELIHAYSLVHDDLPAMDDDDLRRGQPTCHKAFDEATAILSGDALQTQAFNLLAHGMPAGINADRCLEMIATLSQASGSRGMAGGQAMDLAAVGNHLNLTELENMHIHKTGALIRASVKLGALAAPETDRELLKKLDHYANCIGLAFQIKDDILDVEGDTNILGKQKGADLARDKPTYTSLMGLAPAKRRARELHEEAIASLSALGSAAEQLRGISEFIVSRSH